MDSDRYRGYGYWRDETKSIFFILQKGKLTLRGRRYPWARESG